MNAALEWDYSALAAHYERRAPYHPALIRMLRAQGAADAPAPAVDIGAGTGRFTRMLIAAGHPVDAVEPNAAMQVIGAQTVPEARWHSTRAEATGLRAGTYGIVSFASSFNVVAAEIALAEAERLLRPQGSLLLLFNHRDLDDPLQSAIESCIRRHVPDYNTGLRREDPAPQIATHPGFGPVIELQLPLLHRVSGGEFVEGFRAHATLIRQAGAALAAVLEDMSVLAPADQMIEVPFVTRAWMARKLG